MKKMFSSAITAAVLSLLLFSSCKKSGKDLSAPAEILAPPNEQKAKHCKITSITTSDAAWAFTSAVFEYNQKGNPVTVTPANIGTGTPRHEFRYSNNHLLTEYIGAYTNGFFEFWYKYQYDNQRRIIRDTQFVFGQYLQQPTNPFYVRVTDYVYDAQDRIIQTTTTQLQPGPDVFVRNYAYDALGNLTGRVYDDKVNLHRTNKIYQFIDRDYSVNNPVAPNGYNEAGLPTGYNAPPFPQSFLHGTIFMGSSVITYDCKGN